MLSGFCHRRYYPEKLSLIGFKDPDTKKKLIFLTNNFILSAYTITQIYKAILQSGYYLKDVADYLKVYYTKVSKAFKKSESED